MKPSVSIFVAAYNEEANIKNFLSCILQQQQTTYTIAEIIVMSDGSADHTVEEAQSLSDPRIRVIAWPERIGKSAHLNWFFTHAVGDIPVFFDADVVLDSPLTIAALIQPILDNQNVGLVGGNAQQTPGRTFVENAINLSCQVFDQVRIQHHGGNNAYGANGCIMALSKAFAQAVHIPNDTIANDQYLYFSCRKLGYQFIHARQAIAWYRSPSTVSDHLRQNKRFIAAHHRMERLFGAEVVRSEYAVDQRWLRRLKFQAFLRQPIHAAGLFVLNTYCNYLARRDESALDARWAMATTTKDKIILHDS